MSLFKRIAKFLFTPIDTSDIVPIDDNDSHGNFGNTVIVKKDNINEVLCEHKSEYGNLPECYCIRCFYSKEGIKSSYSYATSDNMLLVGDYMGTRPKIFHSVRSANRFLEEKISNADSFYAIRICDLNLPEYDKITI